MYQVIRIEHTDGWGMFRWNDKTGERYTIGDSVESMPMYQLHKNRNNPYEDNIDDFNDDMFCAFINLDTFNELVEKPSLLYLLDKGFKVLMLTVTKIKKGEHQVCYYKEDVMQITDISAIFK